MSEERERQAPGIRSTRVGFASAMGVSAAELEPEPGPAADAIASASQDTIPAGTGRHTIVSARFGGVAPTQAPPERTRLRLIAGKVIPGTRYRLIRWLGEGGMGVVYEAEHIDIERHVALKILRYDLSQQPEMTQVFRDEARAASRMGHANIVEVFDFGELPDGRLFFCMELLDGKDLVPDEGKVRPPAEVLAILRQLCKGLAAAHQQGIVHRDIKPENIILVKRGGRDGVVKLVDFGISAMLAADSKNSSERITGTPHYMAPEQIQGQAFDGRLDMYAVGCVAYELLTGCAPFPGEVVEEVLLAQIDNPPRPPCSTDKGAATPPALEAVILRCLEKRPADRYADMNDLEAALCEAQIAAGLRTDWDDLPLPDVDPDRVARLRRQMPSPHAEPARRRWLLPVSIAASLAAGVVLTFALIGGEPTPQARSEVDRIAEEALQAASLTNYVAPPPDDPSAPTAYQKVLALEALEGSAEAIADERAKDLRLRFSTGLLALGDKYWDVARPFAIEYYIWARTFDPDNQRAVQRSGLSIGNFVAFQERAARGAWQEGELRALLLVGAMAEGDDVRRQTRVEQALASNTYSPRDEVALDEQLRGAGIKVPPPRRRPEPPPPPQPPPPAPDPVDELMPVPLPDDSVLPGDGRPGKKPTLTRNRRDPKRARALAEEGSAALRAGRRGDAENLFHQAIAYDNRNVKALMGLSDVYFDTGAKQKSLQFAELAVEAAPQSRASNLKLGDAYYNVLRYRDALRHYKKAQELGETSAQGRIDKVTARIGD
jgi:serine/threonine protein kinase